jgi:protein-tyrosine phosphatase
MTSLGIFARLTHPLSVIEGFIFILCVITAVVVLLPSTAVTTTVEIWLLTFAWLIMLFIVAFIASLYGLGMKTCKSKLNKGLIDTQSAERIISSFVMHSLQVKSGGIISMSYAPGKKSKEESRNFGEDLDILKSNGVHTIVTLLEEWELDRSSNGGGVVKFKSEVCDRGMEWIHCSVRDKWVPSHTPIFISDVVNPIINLMKEGKRVHVHCHGGKGRTGTLVGAVLLSLDKELSLSEAVKQMRACRSGMLKNPLHHWYLYWLLFHGMLDRE